MFNAIRFGKAGKVQVRSGDSISWLSLYRTREDLLSATVIERLTYLPASLLLTLLHSACFPQQVLPRSLGEVVTVEFWPKLRRPLHANLLVEPDAIITFERGVLIVEAKRFDLSMHTAEQWAEEWSAYHHDLAQSENPYSIDVNDVFLIALGGFERANVAGVTELARMAQDLLTQRSPALYPKLKALACPWFELGKAVREQRAARANLWDHSGLRFILADLDAAFEVHGFRPAQWLSDLPTQNLKDLDQHVLNVADFATAQENQLPMVKGDLVWSTLRELPTIEVDINELKRLQHG